MKATVRYQLRTLTITKPPYLMLEIKKARQVDEHDYPRGSNKLTSKLQPSAQLKLH